MCVGMSVVCQINCVGRIRGPRACSKSFLGGQNLPVTPVLLILTMRKSNFSMTKKKCSLRNEKLKANRASETEEQRKERLRMRIRHENEKIENHEKQRLSTLKRLKHGEVEEKPKTGEGGH